jgi:hypothetical protein
MMNQWSTALTTALLTGLVSVGASGCGQDETTPAGLSASTGSQGGAGGGQGGAGGGQGGAAGGQGGAGGGQGGAGTSENESCNTGVDEDGDGLVDCADPDCAADPICSSGNETLCDNLKDEDDDFLIDCEDPTDCQALAVCQPGAGPTGSPCLSHNACSANNNDPLCLSEQVFGFMGGYCSEFCDLALNDCAPEAFCMPTHFSSGGVCVAICAGDADCRPGYRCMGIGSGSPFPFCWGASEDCTNGVDDDDDTLVDCMDQSCKDEVECFESCDNGIDDNKNGLIDCEDWACEDDSSCPEDDDAQCSNLKDDDEDGLTDCEDPTDCKTLAVCQPGAGPTGSPCLSHNACSANNNDPACLTALDGEITFPGGYCSEFCDPALNDCGPGSLCSPPTFPSGAGLCVDICAVDADCRPGYTCQDMGIGSPFCWEAIEVCTNGVDDDGDTLVDCMDEECQLDPACPEICDNGIDDNANGVIDCEDWTCEADPACSENDDAQCSNGYDDDGDTLIDCEDATDCKALAVCQPGAGPAGSPCLSANACSANNNDPLCLTEADGFPGGYCSEFCGPALNDCAPGSLCTWYWFPSGAGICADICAVNADCRPGYTCQDMGHSSPICWEPIEDCANGVDDDGDALVDCMDQTCEYELACQPPEVPEVCNDGIDDNGNGLIDCEDSTCAAAPTCPHATVCAGAIPLSDGVPYSGDTTTGTSIFAGSCAGSGGLEKVFSFTPGMAGQTGMLVVGLSSATGHGLYVRAACEESSFDLPCSGGKDFGFGFSAAGGVPYWIFVDGSFEPAGAGPFTVTATFTVCGNGILEGFEDCDPPDGVTCDANCYFAAPPETSCTDLLDGDNDGLTDCEDPTPCKALPICTPGATPVGGVCSAASDCQANNTDPVCIDQIQFGWPQGYCTELCDLSTNDCPASSTCAPMLRASDSTGLCMASCAVDADCRAGYTCADIGGSKVCFDL